MDLVDLRGELEIALAAFGQRIACGGQDMVVIPGEILGQCCWIAPTVSGSAKVVMVSGADPAGS
jgi:hypothetical protein